MAGESKIQGRCKWFNGQRGFGFIKGMDGKDYFVHQTSILSNGWRNLEVNQSVEFKVKEENDRLKAVEVTAPGGNPVKRENKTNKQVDACFAFRNGDCSYGKNCKFSHEEKDMLYTADEPRRGHTSRYSRPKDVLPLCFDFQEGKCVRGRSCKYYHCPTE